MKLVKPQPRHFINREISWLAFNGRVLQEALDPTVPLLQRIRFLGIFSNNLDEFFRVRVATIRRMAALKTGKTILGGKTPEKILDEIQKIVVKQQKKHYKIYMELLQELKKHSIYIINEKQVDEEQGKFIEKYFEQKVQQAIVPIMIKHTPEFPDLNDHSIYFAIKLSSQDNLKKPEYALIEVATDVIPRFTVLPQKGSKKYIMILDDIIRYCLKYIFTSFDYDKIDAFTIKITRDAELDFEDDFEKSFIEKMANSLKKRKKGDTVRFTYDSKIPSDLLDFLLDKLKLAKSDHIIEGARYHNFKDFIGFPSIGPKRFENKPAPPLPCACFKPQESIMAAMRKNDVVLHYPYQSFTHYIDLIREAAIDINVTSIKITLYRVAKHSKVINALINAAKNGKKVTVVIELLARFDEEPNIYWSNKLQEAGIKVIFGIPGLKVHCKLTLINRKEHGKIHHYAYIGTGNYHEGTARIYCDDGIFTYDRRITEEVAKVFHFFKNNYKLYSYQHLVVAPFNMRSHFEQLIYNEVYQAKRGKPAAIYLKLNSLVDEQMIKKLYEASQYGVKIKLIIRGICSLIPGIPGLSENIEAISIVDKYLEHSRIYMFHNKGDELIYISSADWMSRNLDFRIEVACPVYDTNIKDELLKMFEIQLRDNVKARIQGGTQENPYKPSSLKRKIRAQEAYYNYLKRKSDPC